MNKLNKVTYVGSKVVEVIGWMVFVIALVGMILGIIQPQVYTMILTEGNIPLNIQVGSIGIEVLDQSNGTTFLGTMFFALLAFGLCLAMISRNIHLLFRNVLKGISPFNQTTVRLIREIGIFIISLEIVNVMITIVLRVLVGPDFAETSVGLMGILIGIVILCLSGIFSYGVSLQTEVDELL